MNKTIDTVVIHCSASSFGCAREIRKWHLEKGWKDIAYHFVILNGQVGSELYLSSLDGAIECGRFLDGDGLIEESEAGAHALGYNDHSIGVCLIGKPFTIAQFDSLKRFLIEICRKWSIKPEKVIGHYETASGKAEGKTCPDFDVEPFRAYLKGRL